MSSESPWHIFSLLRLVDKFGQPIPAFNINGKNKNNTVVGGILTTSILAVTLGYFASSLQGTITGSNDVISYSV